MDNVKTLVTSTQTTDSRSIGRSIVAYMYVQSTSNMSRALPTKDNELAGRLHKLVLVIQPVQ